MFKDSALSLTKTAAKFVLKAKKNSPHLFFAGGLIGTMGSTYLACRATLKLEKTIEKIKIEADGVDVTGTISDVERGRELTKVYVKGSVEVAKLYGPAVIVGAASIAALSGSHVQLTRRNAALSATLGLVTQAFDEYRERVRAEIGEEKEYEVYRGISTETVDEDGKKKIVKVLDPNVKTPYSFLFDEYNPNWQPYAEANFIFLKHQQNYWNDYLHAKGYVFLNDVLESLGFERTQAGCTLGWFDGPEGKDHCVDFGVLDNQSLIVRGIPDGVMLEFNVDGEIHRLIENRTPAQIDSRYTR